MTILLPFNLQPINYFIVLSKQPNSQPANPPSREERPNQNYNKRKESILIVCS